LNLVHSGSGNLSKVFITPPYYFVIAFMTVRLFVRLMPKKTQKPRVPPAPNSSPFHPEAVASLAAAMPWKIKVRFFEVEAYTEAICKLHDRGYSFAEITDWLNERLESKLEGKKIKRGQVYRVFQQWVQDKNEQEDISFGIISSMKKILTEQEAEAEAERSDRDRLKTTGNKNP
jgi:hypothetical protein